MSEQKQGLGLIPQEIPGRVRNSKYANLVQQFVDSGEPSGKINLGETKLETAAQGFYKAIRTSGVADKVQIKRVNGSLFIKRV